MAAARRREFEEESGVFPFSREREAGVGGFVFPRVHIFTSRRASNARADSIESPRDPSERSAFSRRRVEPSKRVARRPRGHANRPAPAPNRVRFSRRSIAHTSSSRTVSACAFSSESPRRSRREASFPEAGEGEPPGYPLPSETEAARQPATAREGRAARRRALRPSPLGRDDSDN